MRVDTELAYILHKRSFRDTSQILDVFTRSHGRISLMSKGSRSPRSKTSGVLQLFRPLLLSWQGRGEMPFLNKVEMAEVTPPVLSGVGLKSGIYINELLVYMLHKNDVHSDIFELYHDVLYQLAEAGNVEITLRLFEKKLLESLGFGLNLRTDADTGQSLMSENQYLYHFEHGPVANDKSNYSTKNPVLSGACLIAYQQEQLVSSEHLTEIKRLMRFVIDAHLGHRKLRSRELFRRRMITTR